MAERSLYFDVLIKEPFASINTDTTLSITDKKDVLSLINDFEGGKWREERFDDFIWNNISLTCLSKNERDSLISEHRTILRKAAKKLKFSEKDVVGQGSELAEIMLYGIMREYYDALSVVPKIFYKQNSQDPAKGADSVHIVTTEQDFSIWFGEAKFYNDISDTRLSTIIESVGNSLNTDKIRKENSIILGVSDLYNLEIDPDLLKNIIKFLSDGTSIDIIKTKLHVPILLLHECGITNRHNELTDEYKKEIITHHKDRAQSYFTKQINKISKAIHKYEEIHFHIILFPVPCKKDIVDRFNNERQLFVR